MRFEAETVRAAASGTTSVIADPSASPAQSGSYLRLGGSAAGGWVEFTVSVPAPGLYNIATMGRCTAAGGQAQLAVNGSPVGAVADEYVAPSLGSYRWLAFDSGPVQFDTAGPQTLRYTVTGRNAAASGYDWTVDYIDVGLVPQLRISGPPSIAVGQSASLAVSFLDLEPYYADPKYVVWRSTDDTVVSVDAAGTITGASHGAATITAQNLYAHTAVATLTVTVS